MSRQTVGNGCSAAISAGLGLRGRHAGLAQPRSEVPGRQLRQRSVHHPCFTLPALIAKWSRQRGWRYTGPNNWIELESLYIATKVTSDEPYLGKLHPSTEFPRGRGAASLFTAINLKE